MDRVALSSSMLASAGHDEDSNFLELEFKVGTAYRYFQVPRHVYEQLLSAASPGTFFRDHIFEKYPAQRLR